MGKRQRVRIQIHGSRPGHVDVYIDPEMGEVDALYFRWRRGQIAKSIEVSDWAVADFDSKGRLLGLEMLEPGTVTVKDLKSLAHKCKEPAVADLRPKQIMAGIGV